MLININRKDHLIELRSKNPLDTLVDLALAPAEAVTLLAVLNAHTAEIYDLAHNYYDCHECGYAHHNDVKRCPDLLAREEEE